MCFIELKLYSSNKCNFIHPARLPFHSLIVVDAIYLVSTSFAARVYQLPHLRMAGSIYLVNMMYRSIIRRISCHFHLVWPVGKYLRKAVVSSLVLSQTLFVDISPSVSLAPLRKYSSSCSETQILLDTILTKRPFVGTEE